MNVELVTDRWLTAVASILRRSEPHGPLIRFSVPAYIVESGQQRILIDAGLHPAAAADAAAFNGRFDALTCSRTSRS